MPATASSTAMIDGSPCRPPAICASTLQLADKQGTFGQSRFLDACRAYNRGEQTTRLGFNNVIDVFHIVNQGEVPVRSFTDERRRSARGIRLTDDLRRVARTSSTATFASSLRRDGGS